MDVKLPKLGEGADSGVVISILVKEGDRITEGQTLIEIENEKAVAPIPSSAAGTVERIRVKEGATITVGTVILTLAETDGPTRPARSDGSTVGVAKPTTTMGRKRATSGAASAEPPEPVQERKVDELPGKLGTPVAAAPAIRRLARELGIDLDRVRGSERGGRIGMSDLRTYVELVQRLAFQREAEVEPRGGPPGPPVPESIDFSRWGPVARKPLSTLRRTIARRMTESWVATPRVTQFDEADITGLNEMRKRHAPAYESRGARLTLTALVLKAVVDTLRQHPVLNSSLDEAAGELVVKHYYHVGLAVDTEAGLIVPVIRDVDRKSLLDLAVEIEAAAAKARDRKVAREDLQGGTFTISNQGGIGGGHFTPIVNRPEVAILGLGRGVLKPAVREGRIEPRLLLPVALSYDHRVIDGGVAARFVVDLVRALEGFGEDRVRL